MTAVNAAKQENLLACHIGHACHRFVSPVLYSMDVTPVLGRLCMEFDVTYRKKGFKIFQVITALNIRQWSSGLRHCIDLKMVTDVSVKSIAFILIV